MDDDEYRLKRELARMKVNMVPPRRDIVWRIIATMPFMVFALFWTNLHFWDVRSWGFGVKVALVAIILLGWYRHLKYDPADRLKIGYDDLYDFSRPKPFSTDTDDLSTDGK